MEKIKSLMLMVVMIVMSGMVCSCGSDDDDNNNGGGSGSTIGTYVLHCTLSDAGTMPKEYADILKKSLEESVNTAYQNVSLDVVKAALDTAVEDAIRNGSYDNEQYNYTIEFYITDSNNKKVYSRYIVVKDGKATAK